MLFLLSGKPGSEKKKLVGLCVLFVVVLGAFWLSSRRSETVHTQIVGQTVPGLPAAADGVKPPPPAGVIRVAPDTETSNLAGEVTDRTGTIEQGYLFELLQEVNRASIQDLKARSRPASFGDIFDNPEEWRGKVIRVRGRVHRLTRRKGVTLPEGIDVTYEAYVMDPNRYWYQVFIVGKPSFGTDDLVIFYGIFMKIHAYESIRGTIVRAPVVVCKDFEKFEIKPPSFFEKVGWGAAVVVGVCLIFILFIVREQKRSSEALARGIENKRLKKARRWAQSEKKEDEDTEEKS